VKCWEFDEKSVKDEGNIRDMENSIS